MSHLTFWKKVEVGSFVGVYWVGPYVTFWITVTACCGDCRSKVLVYHLKMIGRSKKRAH